MRSLLLLLAITSTAAALTLGWDASPGARGYKLYYGTQSSNYTSVIDAGTNLSVRIPGLVVGQQYFFAVSAYSLTAESDLSAEITAVQGPTNSVPPSVPPSVAIVAAIQKADVIGGPWSNIVSMSTNDFANGAGFYRAVMSIKPNP